MANKSTKIPLYWNENGNYDCSELLWQIFEDKSYNFTNLFLIYIRGPAIHCCKSYTKSFLSTLFVVFCFEITFKIVKMRSISVVNFFHKNSLIVGEDLQLIATFLGIFVSTSAVSSQSPGPSSHPKQILPKPAHRGPKS